MKLQSNAHKYKSFCVRGSGNLVPHRALPSTIPPRPARHGAGLGRVATGPEFDPIMSRRRRDRFMANDR